MLAHGCRSLRDVDRVRCATRRPTLAISSTEAPDRRAIRRFCSVARAGSCQSCALNGRAGARACEGGGSGRSFSDCPRQSCACDLPEGKLTKLTVPRGIARRGLGRPVERDSDSAAAPSASLRHRRGAVGKWFLSEPGMSGMGGKLALAINQHVGEALCRTMGSKRS